MGMKCECLHHPDHPSRLRFAAHLRMRAIETPHAEEARPRRLEACFNKAAPLSRPSGTLSPREREMTIISLLPLGEGGAKRRMSGNNHTALR